MQTFSRRNLIKAAGLSSVFGMLGLSLDPLQAAEHAKGVKLNPKMVALRTLPHVYARNMSQYVSR